MVAQESLKEGVYRRAYLDINFRNYKNLVNKKFVRKEKVYIFAVPIKGAQE